MLEDATTSSVPLASSVKRAAERTDLSKSYLRNEIRAAGCRSLAKAGKILILEEDLHYSSVAGATRRMKDAGRWRANV
jgi:hypothetical protein